MSRVVRSNAQLLRRLLEQVADLNHYVYELGDSLAGLRDQIKEGELCDPRLQDRQADFDHAGWHGEEGVAEPGDTRWDEIDEVAEGEMANADSELSILTRELDELRQQNAELASKVARSNVSNVVSREGSLESMTWEERKRLIIEQMETEAFDAESFVANMPYQSEDEGESPEQFVEHLHRELLSRDEELKELRHLLDQQSTTCDRNVAIGATAIAELIDQDELVNQERERLQQLQAEWEEKFREGEIEASLERAKISRERQSLAKRQAELDEELEQLRQELRHQQDDTGRKVSGRWRSKLGLAEG